MPQVRWTQPSPSQHMFRHRLREGEAKGSSSVGRAQAAQPWDHLLSNDELSQTAPKVKLGPFSGTTACGLLQLIQKGRGGLGNPPTHQDRENGVFLPEDTPALQNPTYPWPPFGRFAWRKSALLKAHHHHPCQQAPSRLSAARPASRAVPGPFLSLDVLSRGCSPVQTSSLPRHRFCSPAPRSFREKVLSLGTATKAAARKTLQLGYEREKLFQRWQR